MDCPNDCARQLIADKGLQGTAMAVNGKNAEPCNFYVRRESEAPSLDMLVEGK